MADIFAHRICIFLDSKIMARYFHCFKHFRVIAVYVMLEDFEGVLTTCREINPVRCKIMLNLRKGPRK